MSERSRLLDALSSLECVAREQPAFSALLDALSEAEGEESLLLVRNLPVLDEEWISRAERGMKYIRECIAEERQFIRSNGEVLPIEKVKKVSKESVRHLARHGELIGKDPEEGEDLLPDKLFSVERLNDYATYENRFLYSLLLLLDDFTLQKYDAICAFADTYQGKMTLRKAVKSGERTISYEFDLTDKLPRDARIHFLNAHLFERLSLLRDSVRRALDHPLMREVSRVDRIRGALVKTNVLVHDKNFREAASLYEYLLAYRGDGFRIEEKRVALTPNTETLRLLNLTLGLSGLVFEQIALPEPAEGEKNGQDPALSGELLIAALKQTIAEQERTLAEREAVLAQERAERSAEQKAIAQERARDARQKEKERAEREADYTAKREALCASFRSEKEEWEQEKAKLERTISEKNARLHALNGVEAEADIDELERELEALTRKVGAAWKGTKRALRAQFFADLKAETIGKKQKKEGAQDAEG